MSAAGLRRAAGERTGSAAVLIARPSRTRGGARNPGQGGIPRAAPFTHRSRIYLIIGLVLPLAASR